MGHNTSPRQQLGRILETLLDEWTTAHLRLDCGNALCARGRRYLVRDLARMYPGLTVGQAIARMRCATCRHPPERAAFLCPHADPRREPQVLMLKGGDLA